MPVSLVFVSYSRINEEAVKQLVADLQAVGVETWHDQRLDGGQDWWDTILVKIRECDLFIFALSPESRASEACQSELKYVTQLGKPILPVLVSDGINLNLLTPPLNKIQVTDYRQRDKGATLALFKSINRSPAPPPLPDPLPPPPALPISYAVTLKERIDAKEMNHQEQNLLFLEIEEAIEAGRPRAEIRDLLLSLKKRDDLLARVSMKIDAALKKLDEESHPKPSDDDIPEQPDNHNGGHSGPPERPRLCPQCGTQAGAGSVFCGSCGNRLSGSPPNDTGDTSQAGWQSCRYTCAHADFKRVLANVVGWLNSQGFDTRQKSTEHFGLLLQIEKRGGWRSILGMATALDVLFQQSGNTLTVAIGAGNWNDKAISGAAGVLLFPPLAATAGYGAWEQAKMPEKIFAFVGTRVPFK
jgi:hypothetical protein